MKGTTHLAAGFALASMVQTQTPEIIASVGIVLGSVLPDVDKHTSLVGRYIPIIPRLIPHRTITHGLLFAAAAYFLSPYLAVGIVLHLLLDMCNPEGVPLLWPIGKKTRIPIVWRFMRSGGVIDRILGYTLWGIALFLFGQMLLPA